MRWGRLVSKPGGRLEAGLRTEGRRCRARLRTENSCFTIASKQSAIGGH